LGHISPLALVTVFPKFPHQMVHIYQVGCLRKGFIAI